MVFSDEKYTKAMASSVSLRLVIVFLCWMLGVGVGRLTIVIWLMEINLLSSVGMLNIHRSS